MPLLDKLEERKCVETVWGKLIPEKEAYEYATRQIAAFCANVFQVMRILEPDFEKRTSAICEISYQMNMAASSEEYMNGFYNEWNIPEFCEKSSWLGDPVYQRQSGERAGHLSLGYRGSGTLQYDYRHVYCQF